MNFYQDRNDHGHNRMYELAYPAPIHAEQGLNGENNNLPMVIALQGYADAGHAVAEAGTHLLHALEHETLARFNVDDLIDYRSRRPAVTIEDNHVSSHEPLELNLYAMKDVQGSPFLLLAGPEPDLKWEAFSDAVVELAERVAVNRVVTLYAAPMPVPHTRPLLISAHSSDPNLARQYHSWDARMLIPGAASLEVERKFTELGMDAIGITAHVPHYIAASEYPLATKRILEAVTDLTERDLPLKSLEGDIEKVEEQLAEQVGESHEIATVVGALERQYDQEVERLEKRRQNSLLAPGQSIPTGDELGAEFEEFLAAMSNEDQPDNPEEDEDH